MASTAASARGWPRRGRSRGADPIPAPLLLKLFDGVYLLALTAWVGAILFFSFAVAPIIFRVLGAEGGAKFVRALFPRYYAWGVVSGAVALPAFLGVPLAFPEYKGAWVGIQALLIVAGILIFLYCGNSLTPAINAARDAGPSDAGRFDRLHRRSVRLNSVALLIGIVLLVSYATRRPPRTEGIRELSPQERILYEREVGTILDEESRDAVRKELRELIDAKARRSGPGPDAPAARP